MTLSLISLFTFIAALLTIGYCRFNQKTGSLIVAGWAALTLLTGSWHNGVWVLVVLACVILAIINISSLRLNLVSKPSLKLLKRNLPKISETEQQALEAGNTWWDAELFSGKPNFKNLRDLTTSSLTFEEQAYLDGPVEDLCKDLNDWEICHRDLDLPPKIWQQMKHDRLFGMVIPRAYGGLGFSATAHSAVVMKIASRSITAAVTAMVPNSLGPGELLHRYGTKEQKDFYLPRLAQGIDIPCFALTGPEAGSDASAIPDTGVVCKQDFEGKKDVLGIRLNFEKRYITLAPVATLLGLAFRLTDPDQLLGDNNDIGISLALIPTGTDGINIGKRHFPLNIPFQNGPIWGEDVFMPIDWLIGGTEQAGNGWQMLVECLGDGRGISLPALATGSGKLLSHVTGAYAGTRKQFGTAIGRFEGIEEPLAEILANTYIMDAGRILTATAIDQEQKPAVITALMKYQLTERMRSVVNHAMDIQGGSGICLGPSNFIGRLYQAVPIGITVEGANILTRSLIIFGQGAIRCHPYLLTEIKAAQNDDLALLDKTLFSHFGFVFSNLTRSVWFGFTNAFFESPGTPVTRKYYRRLARLSASFALLTDYALLTLGGTLKRRERLSGRFADILSSLYLCSAVLKHFEDQGEPHADLPLLDYSCQSLIHDAQQAMLAVFHNLPIPLLGKALRLFMFPFGKPYSPPSDKLMHDVAQLAIKSSATRDRLCEGIYTTDDPTDPTGRIEHAFNLAQAARAIEVRIKRLAKDGRLEAKTATARTEEALEKSLISTKDAALLREARDAMLNAIRVDSFDPEALKQP
ncbi:acyl-CoA dehydrogenase [Leucothrix arctica]|uniref:Acyl-coenzyme A dehydrogenase n=1 Tax=Leucothrix arctica TaxID=1481894 RepID=A0A317C763_9GAMM|nr:acyl-CoA dehydrogenase [Leucothrix arctica]PWQ94137.1 acyl-CoA dehydrogenase [Leucothrix arctica]